MARTKDSAPIDPRAKAEKELEVVSRRVERLTRKYEKAVYDAEESKRALDLALATRDYLSQHPALSLPAPEPVEDDEEDDDENIEEPEMADAPL